MTILFRGQDLRCSLCGHNRIVIPTGAPQERSGGTCGLSPVITHALEAPGARFSRQEAALADGSKTLRSATVTAVKERFGVGKPGGLGLIAAHSCKTPHLAGAQVAQG